MLFIALWTLADDSGRARAASRFLASTLFPYDEDAIGLIDGWMDELEREGCIRRYSVDGNHYLDIPKWLTHQKIDKPSGSKLPPFVEHSRGLDEPSRKIALEQGGEGKGEGEEVLSLEQVKSAVMTIGIPDEFVALVYEDWIDQGGKNGSGVDVEIVGYVRKRWRHEQVDWRNGTHRSLTQAEKPERDGPNI